MSPTLLAAGAAMGLLAVVELVRRRRLREEFSWLWLLAFAALLAVALAPGARARLNAWLPSEGDAGPLLLVAVAFLLALSLDLSIKMSRFATRQKNLAQEIALLRRRLNEVEPEEGRGRDRDA